MTKACETCGKFFEALGNRRFCSPECFRKSRQIKVQRNKRAWKERKIKTITPKIVEIINDGQTDSCFDSRFDSVQTLQSFSDLRKFITSLILGVRDGTVDPKRAQAISSLLRPLIEVLQSEELEGRLDELEKVANSK